LRVAETTSCPSTIERRAIDSGGMTAKLPERLREALASGRVHSGYLLSGPAAETGAIARSFVRALVCQPGSAEEQPPCGSCPGCLRSAEREEPEIDGTGKRGPLYRHVGDHPDLLWVARGPDDTRVRIGQIRAVSQKLALRGGPRRACVVADASWLNIEAQNALLRVLEEPPPGTTFVLLCESPAALLATVRSRCQRVPVAPAAASDKEEATEIHAQLDAFVEASAARSGESVLDWAETFRGPRSIAAEGVAGLLEHASSWLHRRVAEGAVPNGEPTEPLLGAWRELRHCRKALAQRNANPQMIAERALFAIDRAFRTRPPGRNAARG
jgi:hypothetical protein